MIRLPEKNFATLSYLHDSWPDVSFAVIGATGLALRGHPPPRRSEDVDITVAVEPEAFRELRSRLQPGGWEQVRRTPHHWRHYARGLSIDIIPAGAPPGRVAEYILGRGLSLDVRGMEVAIAHAEFVPTGCIEDASASVSAPVPPLAVLVMLKMFAFVDQPALRAKDATDVGRVLAHYLGDDDERRWSTPVAQVEDEDFKGACALALDLRPMLPEAYLPRVEAFLDDARVRGALGALFSGVPDGGEAIVRAFHQGLDHVE